MFITYEQTSEQSYLLDYGEDINFITNKKVISHFKYLLKKNYKYILNVVPSFNKLLIVFDIEFKKDIEILIKKLKSIKDYELLKIINTANIACGYHAGSKEIIQETIINAKKFGVSIGAHPGFDDKLNFGRKRINLTLQELSLIHI